MKALREEVARAGHLTVAEVARNRKVSEATIRNLVDVGLLPAVDMTPGSQIRTLRVDPRDVILLSERTREYARAKAEGREAEYLAELEAEIERRDREDRGAIAASVADRRKPRPRCECCGRALPSEP